MQRFSQPGFMASFYRYSSCQCVRLADKAPWPLVIISGLFMLSSLCLHGQVTFNLVSLPVTTPDSADIYVSGDFEGWSGGSEEFRLTRVNGGIPSITLAQMTGTIQFKFTLGSWQTVEKGPAGEEIANRRYTFGGNGDTVDIEIASWAGVPSSTAAENVELFNSTFAMPQFGQRTRAIWVYLPPDYHSSDKRYPVLYMHDGQNIFDDSTSFAGEWEVDETMNRLATEENIELIVVGIANGGANRIDEYSPWHNPVYGGGDGELYTEFIVQSLKPAIDSAYRTLADRENTGIMGSSMGGLISHYAALAEPGVFGRAGVFSPSFGLFDSCYQYAHVTSDLDHTRMYLLAGGQEGSGSVIVSTESMIDTMVSGGFDSMDIAFEIEPAGTHSEAFWREEFADAVKWLFAASPVSTTGRAKLVGGIAVDIFPNPTEGFIEIDVDDDLVEYQIGIYTLAGNSVFARSFTGDVQYDLDSLVTGIYALRIENDEGIYVTRLVIH